MSRLAVLKEKLFKDFSLREKQALFFLALILSLSFLLRIYTLSAESLWVDEVLSIINARSNLTTLIERVSGVHPPFYYIILHFWMKLFGDSEFSVRFVSVIFGVASVYVIYRFGKLVYGGEIGMISAFILSISLFHIRQSQDARPYTLLAFLILLSSYYFVKMLKERNVKNTAAYIISTAATLYTHNFGLFYIIFQNIYYLLIFRRDIKFWIATQSAVMLLFAPWIPVLVKQVEVGGLTPCRPHPTFFTFFNTFKSFAGNEISLYLFIILGVAGIISIYKQELNGRIFLLLWLFIPIVTSLSISLIYQPIYFDKYVIGSLPALVLLVSKGIFNFRKSLIISFLLIILILPAISPLERYYRVSEKEQWREVASYIENNKGDNDFVILYERKVAFSYYYNGSNLAVISRASSIKNFTKGRVGVWLIIYPRPWWPPKKINESKLFEETLAQTHAKQYSVKFVGINNLSYYLTKEHEVDQAQLNQSKIIYLTGNSTKVAQSFIPERKELDAVQLRAAKPIDEIKVYIQTDNNGIPSGNTISNVTIAKPYGRTNFTAKVGRITLEPGSKYWIIVERTKGNVSLYGEGAGKNITLKIYNSKTGVWNYSAQGNGLYFKTLFINEPR